MAEDTQKRFERIMSKLSQPASPRNKNPLVSRNGAKNKNEESGLRVSTRSIASADESGTKCRPWDRGDLMRRLATFKAMTWFGKPKAISPVNCARRGWVNIEVDVITCEACGARLLFSTPSSWTLQQVEKAAAVFSLKLDNGHKLLCPWIDNACDESLALFPPTPPPALVDSYKERSSELLKLTALPVITSSTIDYMWCPQLELLLSQSSCAPVTLTNGIRLVDNVQSKDLVGADATAEMYYQAQKVISLCGWEPSLLPYIVDGEGQPSESSRKKIGEQNINPIIYRSDSAEVEGEDSHQPSVGENQYDPASVVLDCRFCGARVGLWAFTTVQRPLECFTVTADPDGQNGSANRCKDLVCYMETSKVKNFSKDLISSTSKERPLGLNLTIAGGLPPTKQNFRPVVSFPIISRHLRAEFTCASGSRDYLSLEASFENHESSQFHLQGDFSSQQEKNANSNIGVPSEDTRLLKRKRTENEISPHENNDVNDPSQSKKQLQTLRDGLGDVEKHEGSNTQKAESLEQSNDAGGKHPSSTTQTGHSPGEDHGEIINCKEFTNNGVEDSDAATASPGGTTERNTLPTAMETTDNVSPSEIVCTTSNAEPSTRDSESCETDSNLTQPTGNGSEKRIDENFDPDNLQTPKANDKRINRLDGTPSAGNRNEKVDHGSRKSFSPESLQKTSEFDPIRQHRPFCPWISSEGKSLPGWRLTLNALIQQDKVSSSDVQQLDSSSTSVDEGDDPLVSIRKLFMTPPSKRRKSNC